MILYLHGLNSSSLSSKAILTQEYCDALCLACKAPNLPHQPGQAWDLMVSLCVENENVLVIGSSLGGYYATSLVERGYAVGAILINPAVQVAEKLVASVGNVQTNYTTDEKYVMTAQHIAQWRKMYIEQIADPARYLLLTQTGDEVLDYREAVRYFEGATQIIERGGNHGFLLMSVSCR